MKDLVLACDLGTGGLKGAVVAPDGRLLASAIRGYQTLYPGDGLHEQRPTDWWQALIAVTREMLAAGVDPGDIRAISLSGHSLGCIPVDGAGRLL